jgi:8-amino-7-oxononanoate synthase
MTLIAERLEKIRAQGRYRFLRTVLSPQGPEFILDGKKVICLSSNNYLGLASHPVLIQSAIDALHKYGVGAGASRLISGNMELHLKLEEKIARFKRSERALVFNSGYHANIGIIQALVGKGDYIYSDELNHASIIDGARLSRATIRVYPHCDTQKLSQMIEEDGNGGTKLIVTDSVFSMDGDIAPLEELVRIKERYNALLMIDEAHATGVVGSQGRGVADKLGLTDKIDITMGTLGKALGCFGAYVCGSAEMIEYLINSARSFIFSTALPPAVVASAITALEILESQPELIEQLHRNASFMRDGLKNLGLPIPDGETPIIPLIIGEELKTMKICDALLERGVFAHGIRPPSVPPGTSRLRITVMATHTKEHLEKALWAFGEILQVGKTF